MNNLDKANAARVGVKPIRRTPLEKAAMAPKSLRLAINGKYYDCEGRDVDPNVQRRIGNCVCPDCPLYPVRPYQNLENR